MEKHKKPTMSDIAMQAGVSQSTVSLVLNGSTSVKIAPATQEKVRAVAESLGYHNKKVVHASGRPKKLAMVINVLSNYDPFIHAINAVYAEAWGSDYIVSTFNYSHDELLASKIETEINRGDYAGLIYASTMTRELEKLRINSTLPTVLLNCTCDALPEVPSILPGDKIGAYKATAHLTSQGYRRIAMLTGEQWMIASVHRAEGYRQALIDADIIPNEQYVLPANWSLQEAHQQTLRLLALDNPPQAIFCCSDYMALGCYQAIASLGLKIPDDIAVVGYDDQHIAAESLPPLSTIVQPYAEVGKQAVESLISLIEDKRLLFSNRKVEGDLIVRSSSTNPNL
jgi:LacI family transcriptional regulator